MKQILVSSLLVISLVCTATSLRAAETTELELLIQKALTNNPEIQASTHRATAAQNRISQAAALPDPKIGFQMNDVPTNDFGFSSSEMSSKNFMVQQTIPFPGKRLLSKRAERERARSVEALSEETANRIRYEMTATYYDLYRLEKEIEVVTKNQGLLKNLSNVAESRYSAGLASGPDVFRSRTFQDTLASTLLQLKQERDSTLIRMNALMNQPPEALLELHYDLLTSIPPSEDVLVFENRPWLKAMDHQRQAADKRAARAKADLLPDIDLGATYRQRNTISSIAGSGQDFMMGSVMINLPLWAYWKQAPAIREANAEKIAARYDYEAVLNASRADTLETYQSLKRLFAQLDLYEKSILPKSRATFNSSFTAYQAKRMDFYPTIEALKDQNEMEIAYYDLRASYESNRARLNWVLGKNS